MSRPVRASTIVRHARSARAESVGARIAGMLYRSPDAPDLESLLDRCPPGRVLVVLPESDVYLPADEQRIVREAAEAAGQLVLTGGADHASTIARSWGFAIEREGTGFSGHLAPELMPQERAFLGSVRERQPRGA